METLTVIAYNQPVSRAFIEQVRGVDSSSSVSGLLEKGLIEEAGRLDLPGRPVSFRTTDTFLRVFGLSSLADLRRCTAMHRQMIRPKVRLIHGHGSFRSGRLSAVHPQGGGHPAADFVGAGGAVAAVPLLRGCLLAKRYPYRKSRGTGITFPVFQYPKPEAPTQPEEPKGFTGRLKAKFRAWRAERKRKKAEKKAAQPAKPKAEKPPRQKAKITLDVNLHHAAGRG